MSSQTSADELKKILRFSKKIREKSPPLSPRKSLCHKELHRGPPRINKNFTVLLKNPLSGVDTYASSA